METAGKSFMRKGPGFMTGRYMSGARSFLDYVKGCTPWRQDLAEFERRTLAALIDDPRISDGWDFARVAGDTLSRVNADPRNHFGKHALRRFDNE